MSAGVSCPRRGRPGHAPAGQRPRREVPAGGRGRREWRSRPAHLGPGHRRHGARRSRRGPFPGEGVGVVADGITGRARECTRHGRLPPGPFVRGGLRPVVRTVDQATPRRPRARLLCGVQLRKVPRVMVPGAGLSASGRARCGFVDRPRVFPSRPSPSCRTGRVLVAVPGLRSLPPLRRRVGPPGRTAPRPDLRLSGQRLGGRILLRAGGARR